MSALVLIDGEVCPPGGEHISVFDRGFLYGDSVFETLRTYGGVPFALEQHVARLERSAEKVFIPLSLRGAALGAEIRRAVDLAGNPESYVRVLCTRGRGPLGLDPGLAESPCRVIIVQPLRTLPEQDYQSGVKAITFRAQRIADDTSASGAKLGNYLVSVLAMREAAPRGAAEALIVDAHDQMLEGASSNVFLVCAGRLQTPPESAGILAGITRGEVLAIAGELGIGIELFVPSRASAYASDELFITSSIRELLPIVELDGHVIGKGAPGPVFKRLRAAFRERVLAASSS